MAATPLQDFSLDIRNEQIDHAEMRLNFMAATSAMESTTNLFMTSVVFVTVA